MFDHLIMSNLNPKLFQLFLQILFEYFCSILNKQTEKHGSFENITIPKLHLFKKKKKMFIVFYDELAEPNY